MTLRRWFCGFCVALAVSGPAMVEAYPHVALRPADTVLASPTDGHLASLYFNPASIRLYAGSELFFQGGVHGFVGDFQRRESLPAGFSPGSGATGAQAVPIRWVNPQAMAAGSWDLRKDSVTAAMAFATPAMDRTDYRSDAIPLEQLSTRYHSVSETSYSLWFSLAIGLKLKKWLHMGASFHVGYSRSNQVFLRGVCEAGLCGGETENWNRHELVETNVGNLGYGFSIGAIVVPIADRLWLGLSYTSALLSTQGDWVPLTGQPLQASWVPDACTPGSEGARIENSEGTQRCGAARVSLPFPHTVYVGARLRFPKGGRLSEQSRPFELRAVELVSWMRLLVPGDPDQEIQWERALSGAGAQTLTYRPLSGTASFAIAWGVRQSFRQVVMGQEFLYETPRGDVGVASPGNLDGHKLDVSWSVRAELHKRVSLLFSVGGTWVLFPQETGSLFDPNLQVACGRNGYDVTTSECAMVSRGLAVSPAQGTYTLGIPHGSVGLELHL